MVGHRIFLARLLKQCHGLESILNGLPDQKQSTASPNLLLGRIDRSSSTISVNEARLHMFACKQRPYDAIPPTSAALKEHVKRATFQAGAVWGQATITQPDIPSPGEWGWKLEGQRWFVNWSTLPPIAASCQELAKCSCKQSCTGSCKCYRSTLPCTALCSCDCE